LPVGAADAERLSCLTATVRVQTPITWVYTSTSMPAKGVRKYKARARKPGPAPRQQVSLGMFEDRQTFLSLQKEKSDGERGYSIPTRKTAQYNHHASLLWQAATLPSGTTALN
jgi:hypothetical protein